MSATTSSAAVAPGREGIAVASGALRREAVREFVGGERGAREGVDGKSAVEVEAGIGFGEADSSVLVSLLGGLSS